MKANSVRSLLDDVSRSVAPWNSIDAIAEEWEKAVLPVVTAADVARCMDCKAPECFNCLGGNTGRPAGRPKKAIDLDQLCALIDAHTTAKEICSCLGISANTLRRVKAELLSA